MTSVTKLGELLRWLCAAVVLVFFLYCSMMMAYLPGFSLPSADGSRILDYWWLQVLAVLSGVLGIMAARFILRRRVMSWWLLLAIPIPALVVIDLLRQL